MSSLDDASLPDAQLNPAGLDTSTNQGKFTDIWNKVRDIWWRTCSKTGLAKLVTAIADAVLNRQVAEYGDNWVPTKTMTWLGQEVASLAQNFRNVLNAIAAVLKAVEALQSDVTTIKTQLSTLSAPQLTDTQLAALAQQVAAALPHAPTAEEIKAAVLQGIREQASK